MYLLMGIIKGETAMVLQQKLYRNEDKPKEGKQSAKRLASRVDSLQEALNNMLSLEIHCSIVVKIMQFADREILALKTNSLLLLLQKTPDFQFQLSSERQTQMTLLFEPLVEEAFKFLSLKTTEKDLSQSSEKQKYACALFAMLGKTACRTLEPEAAQSNLKLVLRFFEKQESYPLTLGTQLALTATQMFEVHTTDFLEFLPKQIELVLGACRRTS